MADPTAPTTAASSGPIYAPHEIKPPVVEANSLGGGEAAEDEAPSAPAVPGHDSVHEDAGWRAIEPGRP